MKTLEEYYAALELKNTMLFKAINRINSASSIEEAKGIAAAALAEVIPEFFEADKPIELGVAV